MNSATLNSETGVSLAQAAEALGSTPLNVLMHIKRGLLVGREQAGGWLVDPVSLEALLRRRHGGELPVVCKSGCGKKAGGCGSCA
ncbi:MAG: hypothetical protein FIB02_11675 [Desulfuromonas sp.]|nr:hypothetical protein [Desulfuromonas sp.]